jgi:tRNA pseudouridine55 synthase
MTATPANERMPQPMAHPHALPLAGILNINKPEGISSHDVVNCIRHIFGLRRVGHAGTLDPLATGVLLVFLGQATRVIEYLADEPKIYHAVIRFGTATDTYDREGTVTFSGSVENVTQAAVEQVLKEFVGDIEQIPPAYSALKYKGKPLYKLARKGLQPPLTPRRIRIAKLEVLGWSPPELKLAVHCGAGTYVRSLAHDLGNKLGCGGHLAALTRIAVGEWRLEEAHTLEELRRAVAAGELPGLLQPMNLATRHLPSVCLNENEALRVWQGKQITLPSENNGELLQALNPLGELLAILTPGEEPGQWQPKKVFITSSERISA